MQLYKTNSTMRLQEEQPQKSFMIKRIKRKKIWDLQLGNTHQMYGFYNRM